LDILNELDECLISDSSDDSDESGKCEDGIAVADAAVDEEDSNVEDHSRRDTDYSSGFILEGMDNYHVQRELFSGHSGPQNSAVNVQDIVSVFLLFFSRDIVHKTVVETNRFRSLARQWTPVTTKPI
jgi:hypothetical protein